MKKYIFNEYGVCENPTILDYQLTPDSNLEIEYAQVNDKWIVSYNFEYHNGGISIPLNKEDIGFGSLDDAIVNKVESLIEDMPRHIDDEKDYRDRIIKELRKIILDYSQLSLF